MSDAAGLAIPASCQSGESAGNWGLVHCSSKCSRQDTAGKYCKLEQQVSTAGKDRLGTTGRHQGGTQQTG